MHFGEHLKQRLHGFLTVPCLLGLEPALTTAAPIAAAVSPSVGGALGNSKSGETG